jgi:hypothetical protein
MTVQEYKKKYRIKYVHGRESRKKISNANIGNTKTKGKKILLSREAKVKLSRFWTTFNQLPSTREKRRKQLKGNLFAKGNRHSKEFRRKQSNRMKRLWETPKERKKMRIAQKKN